MKNLIFSALVGITVATAPCSAFADLIAAWDFAGLVAAPNTPETINATVGTGTLDASAFSPLGTNPERTAFAGSTINAFPGGDQTAGMAFVLANNTANGKSLIFSFSMSGFENLVVSFATRGTSTGFDTGTWAWSTDGVAYNTLPGVNTATRSTSFGLATADFSSVSALDNASSAYLSYTLSGATMAAGNNRLDNIQFNAQAVPEPSTASLLVIGAILLGGLSRRR